MRPGRSSPAPTPAAAAAATASGATASRTLHPPHPPGTFTLVGLHHLLCIASQARCHPHCDRTPRASPAQRVTLLLLHSRCQQSHLSATSHSLKRRPAHLSQGR
jgi:hypothetical protein